MRILVFLFLMAIYGNNIKAQSGDCIFRDTLLKIDFGSNSNPQEFNLRSLKYYERDNTNCPQDGYYSYSSETSDCFKGDWITITKDHTSNVPGGKMLFVNASGTPATFFVATLAGFKPNTTYEFAVWMMNLCKVNGGCSPLPPNIVVTLQTDQGKRLAAFQTGQVTSSLNPTWKKYFAFFTTPSEVGNLVLRMDDITNGTCGNDFAMDDITIRECYKPVPVNIVKEVKPQPHHEIKPIPEKEPLKKESLELAKLPVQENQKKTAEIAKLKPVNISLPDVILNRENPIVKKIETEAAELLIELYDNGQIDGDTVSIFHNNELIVSHAGLSEKPISFRIKVDANQPHHELIMVADNLGSIPPNTSLMIITAKGKRYEIFISSSEQKNAKLLIDLK